MIYSTYWGIPKLQIDEEGSVYIISPMLINSFRNIIGGAFLTKFNRQGKIQFKVELPTYCVNISQPQLDKKKNIYVLLNDSKTELEGCIFYVSADGTSVKELIRTNSGIININYSSFVVDEEGNIFTFNQQAEIRNYNNQGKLIYRNKKALEKDKEVLED